MFCTFCQIIVFFSHICFNELEIPHSTSLTMKDVFCQFASIVIRTSTEKKVNEIVVNISTFVQHKLHAFFIFFRGELKQYFKLN